MGLKENLRRENEGKKEKFNGKKKISNSAKEKEKERRRTNGRKIFEEISLLNII